jgi:mannose-6-phosphate isomerase-like protein (cupin superfamily)
MLLRAGDMMMPSSRVDLPEGAVFLPPDRGRIYELGAMRAVFKADRDETQDRYCVSEWWLDPHAAGPGVHLHEGNDEVFYVLEGIAAIRIGDTWLDAARGSFALIPRGILHDFENRTAHRAGLLNFYAPGGFERLMPDIVKWFEENPSTANPRR